MLIELLLSCLLRYLQIITNKIYKILMGCQGSSSVSTGVFTQSKPRVWLIAGGPGSRKNNICEWIVRDYKMKYLSAHDIVQFQRDRNGPDAQKIKQCLNENKPFSSQLVAKLVKKAIASCGVRRFLIEEFPRNIQDIIAFDKLVSPNDITIEKFIYVDADKKMMIESGLQAKKSDKNAKEEENLKVVTDIVQAYLKDIKGIIDEYSKRKKVWRINVNSGPEQAFRSLKDKLNSDGITGPPGVHIYFSHFDDPKYEGVYCDDLIRKYGCYFYSVADLISEASDKKSPQADFIAECKKQKKQISAQFVIALIKKKIQKRDFSGKYLLSGFPRNSYDSQMWMKAFGWETDIKGYISFEIPDNQFKPLFQQRIKKNLPDIKSEDIEKQYKAYQENQIQICKYYENQGKLLKIHSTQQSKVYEAIHRFFNKNGCNQRTNLFPKMNLVFISTLNSDAKKLIDHFAKNKTIKIINFQEILVNKIKEGGLYSQLIDTYLKTGRPIPGNVVVKSLVDELKVLIQGKIIVQGFPNSSEQLTFWQEEVGESMKLNNIIFYELDKKYVSDVVKTQIKEKKLSGNQNQIINIYTKSIESLETKLTTSDWKFTKVKIQDTFEATVNFIQKDLQKSGFLSSK